MHSKTSQSASTIRILHIAPFNTAGVPVTFVKAEREIGHYSRLITLHKHRFEYEEDICLEIPYSNFPGYGILKKLLRPGKPSRDAEGVEHPLTRHFSFPEKQALKLRDTYRTKRISKLFESIDINSFDLYQLDGGVGFYYDSRIIKNLNQLGKPIICTYLGSDLRVRGVIKEIDAISTANFTVEYDHLDLYPGIHFIPHPFDFSNFAFHSKPENTPIVIGHAPSKRSNKGTDEILAALIKIKESYPLEVLVIENQPHIKALELKCTCSLFVDQISDLGYGINSIESAAMGIPTFSSLSPKFKKLNPDAPIIDINAQNIVETITQFVKSAELRKQFSKKSKKWAREFHDSKKIVRSIHKIVGNSLPDIKLGLNKNLL